MLRTCLVLFTLTATLARAQTVSPPAPRTAEEAKEEYEKRLIHFGNWIAVSSSGNVVGAGVSNVPIQGKYLKPLTMTDFYRLVGEPELAEKLEASDRLKRWFEIPGAVLVGAGLVVLFGGIAVAGDCDVFAARTVFTACLDRRNAIREATTIAGVSSAVGGLALLLVGVFLPSPTEPPEVVRERADGYNKRLRKELGLDGQPAKDPTRPTEQASLQLGVMPVFGPNFGGLSLNGRF
jgi:hypothetical protein